MDIGKAFGFVFQDEKWVTKVLLGGVLLIIPIFGQFVVLGYALKVAERVVQQHLQPLPEWGDFGDLFMRGLYFFLITLVYQIPTLLFSCIIGAIAGGASTAIDPDTGAGAGGLIAVTACLYPLLLIAAIILGLASYAAMARYVATGIFSEAFKFGAVISAIRINLGAWALFILVTIMASFIGSLGLIACGVGVLFTYTYAYIVIGHALGQTALRTGLTGAAGYAREPVPPFTPPTTYQ